MEPSTLTVLYDGDCAFCASTASLLRRLDRRRRLRLVQLHEASVPGQPSLDQLVDTLHAVDAEGRWWAGGGALIEISRRVPPLRPLVWLAQLPLARPAINLGYRVVAANRHLISRLLNLKACTRDAPRQ
jgi:predicted DCC family thiol-disulfide oxidoreductase YuxK